MARSPKPWYRADRQAWFVTIDGRRHNLGADEKEAKRKYHELLARPAPKFLSQSAPQLSVADIFEKFLEWSSKHRSAKTYEWLKYRIQMFVGARPNLVTLPFAMLKPFHIIEWIDKRSDWSSTYRRGIITALQRPFNWAVKVGYISENPVRAIEKPAGVRREQVITPQEWLTIRDSYKEGDPFRDLLEFAWETGCRPQEVRYIEARHVQMESHRIVFPKQESKGKKCSRVIYMTPWAEQVINRLLTTRTGMLFLNADGRQWTTDALNCRFCRLKKQLGVKYACYSLRHGFATRKLEDGLDHLTVAALMGHSDGTMVARVYSHLGDRPDYLREKLIGSANLEVPKG